MNKICIHKFRLGADCPHCNEELKPEHYDNHTVEELKDMMDAGRVKEQDLRDHYGNEWWDETP